MARKRIGCQCLVVFLWFFLLVGCAPQTWYKPGADEVEFYRTRSYCDAISRGATPMDYSYQGPTTTYHSGRVGSYSSGGSVRYSGTSTTYGNSFGQSMHNLGQSLSRDRIFKDCMMGHGFSLQQSYNLQEYYDSVNYDPKDVSIIAESVVQDLSEWDESPTEIKYAVLKWNSSLLDRPSFSGKILARIPDTTKLKVLYESNEHWVKVEHDSSHGFIAKKWADLFYD